MHHAQHRTGRLTRLALSGASGQSNQTDRDGLKTVAGTHRLGNSAADSQSDN